MIKRILLVMALVFMTSTIYAQEVISSFDLNQRSALALADQANAEALKLKKNVSIAVLNASGITLLLLKADEIGPHNTEASRRKAYTALSTKTSSFELMRSAVNNLDAQNLNTLPELLLLGGGVPIWKNGHLVGSIGVSGGGSGENDHNIARLAVENQGFKTNKNDKDE